MVVINETAARRLWPGERPIGKRVRLTDIYDGDGAEVVGVVADVRYRAVEAAMTPDVVKANDPTTIAVLATVLIAVTLLAAYIPARRATRVDPLTSLRAE